MEQTMFYLDLQEIVSAFVVLFAVIDVTGLLPVFIDFQNKGMKISPAKAAIYSLIAFVAFLFAGNAILQLFQVDISSFAVAGSLVIFVMAIEMIFGVEIFRNDGPRRVGNAGAYCFSAHSRCGSFIRPAFAAGAVQSARHSHRPGAEYRDCISGAALCFYGREDFRKGICLRAA